MSDPVRTPSPDDVEFLDPEPEPLWTFAYVSEPMHPLSDAAMRRLHLTAQRNNTRDDVTGRLVVVESDSFPTRFVQYVEGPRSALKACARRIFADGRHGRIVVVQSAEIAERRFGQWAMQYEVVDASAVDADVAAALWRIREQAAGADPISV